MGKTALVLSGGGSRGGYEAGVWQALRKLEIPIDIVTGTSVGAINGAMVAQDKLELSLQLWEELETYMIFDVDVKDDKENPFAFQIAGMPSGEALAYLKEIITKGGAQNSGLTNLLSQYVEEDLIRKSSIDFGLVAMELATLKPLYLFKEDIPQGKMQDYILASASCFPAVQAMEIDGKQYIDGGYADVMPVEMAMNKGADKVIAVHLEAAGFVRDDTLKEAREKAEQFTMIKSHWDLGNFLVFDKKNTKRIIRLGYLDTLKEFKVYDGNMFTFKKNAITPMDLSDADAAARVFELNPTVVYSQELLLHELSHQIKKITSSNITDITSFDALKETFSQAAITHYIANDLNKKESESIFLGKGAFRLLKEEILAANYLLKNKLI